MSRRSGALVAALLLSVGTAEAGREESALDPDGDASLQAGRAALDAGRFDEAVSALERAATLHRDAQRPGAQIDALLALSQARLAIGALAEAEESVRALLPLAERAGTESQRAAALAAAGTLALAREDLAEAERLLLEAAARARASGDDALVATIELNRGTLQVLRGDEHEAVRTMRRAARRAEAAGVRALAARAQANAARSLVRIGAFEQAIASAERAQTVASELDAHARAAILVHVAVTYRELTVRAPSRRATLQPRARRALLAALEAARASGDVRSESYALGALGGIYEASGRNQEALSLTREALLVSASLDVPESTYRWEWQSARLLAALGREGEAVAAYERAVRQLASLAPGTLASRRSDASFAEAVEPVYLGLVDLLLRRSARVADAGEADALRARARDLVERSKAAELRDYFRDDCVDAMQARVRSLAEVSSSAAIVHPILLADRLEILLGRPGRPLEQYTVTVPRERVERELREFRRLLLRRTTREYLAPARRLHGWLVAPWRDALHDAGVDTLVFVPGGLLRTVPMAALHDGEQFLVERWAIAVTPGIELSDPRPLEPERRAVLMAGTSRAVAGFPALDHVREELTSLHEMLGGELLLDAEFRRDAIEGALAEGPFGIVHVATHAEFAPEADESFLVTWDGRLSGDELAATIGQLRFRDPPLELLTLSACETAKGSERAALGLLGVAVQAGARSAVGSLWKVNDDSTALLMRTFYEGLVRDGLSRAEALRRAQLALARAPEWQHPLYWSAFVLINGWL